MYLIELKKSKMFFFKIHVIGWYPPSPFKKNSHKLKTLCQIVTDIRSKWGAMNFFVTLFNECCALDLICLIVVISFVWCLHEHSINMKLKETRFAIL